MTKSQMRKEQLASRHPFRLEETFSLAERDYNSIVASSFAGRLDLPSRECASVESSQFGEEGSAGRANSLGGDQTFSNYCNSVGVSGEEKELTATTARRVLLTGFIECQRESDDAGKR